MLFLFLSTEVLNVRGDNVAVNAVSGGDPTKAHARQFLDYRESDLGCGARSTVFFWHVGTEQSCGSQGIPHFARYDVLFFPRLDVR